MTNTTHADSATQALITEVLEPVPQVLPTVNARISPRGGLDVLSRAEIARLRDATSGGLHELLRKCALAVLTVGSDALSRLRHPGAAAGPRHQDRAEGGAGARLRRRRDHPRRGRVAVCRGARHRL